MSKKAVKTANGCAIIEKNKKTPKKHQTEIFEYIRRRKGNKTMKVGVILGVRIKDDVKIGWSKCNMKAGDKFNATVGLQMAMNRAMRKADKPYTVTFTPDCIKKQIRNFAARCARYYKGATKLELPV